MILVTFVLAACAPGSPDPADTGDTGLPAAETRWYLGSSAGEMADGSWAQEEELLAVRTVDPAAATITERFSAVERGGALAEYELVQAVSDGGFEAQFSDGYGTLQVVGQFDAGEDWAWTAWHSTSTYLDGDYVDWYLTSVDAAGEGTHHADKILHQPDGAAYWLVAEDLTEVTEADFDARLAELGG